MFKGLSPVSRFCDTSPVTPMAAQVPLGWNRPESETPKMGLSSQSRLRYLSQMDRTVKKSRDFTAAEAWEREQYQAMSPRERMRAARELKDRLFPGIRPDVRECHTSRKIR
jgi:hypothetical protein